MLITNQKCIVCALLTTFIIFSAMNIAWALSVNERTQQVQDAIVAAVDGVSAAADVTDTHLAAITTLSLYGKEISTLKTGDFSGLSSLTTLYLDNNRLTSLPDDVFSGLSSLRYLYLNNNQLNNLPATLFSSLSSIEEISLNGNRLARLPDNLFTGLTSLRQLMLHKNLLKSLDADTFSGLSSLEYLYLHNNQLTSLPANLFSKLALLKHMLLHNNQLTRLSPGMFRELSTPRLLWLQGNVVNPLSLNISVVKVSENQFKVIVPAGAPFDMNIPLTVTNGSITNGASSVTIAAGTVESKPFIVARALDTTNAVTVDIGTLPSPPMFHFGYVLVNYINTAPVFTEGTSTTRSVAENTDTGTNIGAAVVATDADDDPLTYTLSGNPDAASFAIDNTTGQLKIETALDYEIKSTYTVVVTVSDGEGGSDSISVTINVADVNETPVFADGTTTTRAIVENVGADINIGTVVNATDPDTDDSLTYTLDGTNAASFAIDDKTGQLKTKAALDYETKSSYSVMITVSDGTLTDSITVTINVTNLDETPSNNPPIFDDGEETTRSIDENSDESTDIGSPISATDADNNTLAYLLSGDDASSFDIVSTTGQLKTKAALNYENENTYIVTVTVLDGSSTDTIDVTINVSDVNEAPVFAKESVTRNVAENTAENTSIGSAITATDPDSDTLEYSLGGTDSASFDIVNTTGQLKTKAALDYETKISYSVTITASDDNLTDTISVTINVTDVNENRAPVFSQTSPISLSILIESDTASGDNIGAPVTATDPDNDTLTYSLGGDDASFFSIVSSTGQLQTTAAFLSDTKVSYSITVIANDGKGGTDSINVTVRAVGRTSQQVVNSAPEFTDGDRTTRSVAENTAAGENIGTPVAATDADTNDTLIYTLSGDPDAAAFSIVSTSGQLQTSAALDYETKSSYSVTVSVSDGNGSSDSIAVTISVTDVDENRAPTFTGSSITFSIADIADASVGDSIGIPITATDLDDDTLEYSLSGDDASKFSIDSSSGQLKITQTFIDDTSTSYSIKVITTDPDGATAEISVTITVPRVSVVTQTNDNPPDHNHIPIVVNEDGEPIIGTYEVLVPENRPNYLIGNLKAIDEDEDDTLTYSLDTENMYYSFAPGHKQPYGHLYTINSETGEVRTGSSGLDFEEFEYTYHHTYKLQTVLVRVEDGKGGSVLFGYYVFIVDENDNAPAFSEDNQALSINENEPSGTTVGTVSASDADASAGDHTYSIETENVPFTIESSKRSGTIKTASVLDYETAGSYILTVKVDDGFGTDTIEVTISVTDVDENRAPTFTGSSITFSIADIADASVGDSIGIPITATDLDDDTLEYSLSGDDASKFSIDSSSGQLKITQTFIDDTSTSYSIKVIATDPDGATAEISVTITVPRVSVVTNPVTPLVFLPQVVQSNSAPAFEGTSTTRSITENTASGENIGVPVTATDSDIGDTLTYSLEGTDAESFSIVTTSGQLQTSAALDFENKPSYEVTVKVTDDSGASNNSATITVTINVSDVNEAPTFLDGESVALSVNKGERLSTSIRVTDDDDDTLEYSLGGPDAALFSIINKDTQYYVPSTNKWHTEFNVQSKAALDYDGKTSYSVTITVSDDNGGSGIVTVAITDPAPEVEINTMIGAIEPDWVLKLDTETGIVSADLRDTYFSNLVGTSSVSFTRPPDVKFDNSFTVVINLSEEVSGFEKADLTLTNNTAGATISHWAGHEKLSGWIVYAEVNVTMSGSVTLEVAAGAATDGSGNSNAAAESKTVNVTITLTDYPPWDVDEDGSVDDDDTALVTAALGQSGADIVNERTDVNWDDTVDADDVALVTYHISGGAPSIIGTFSLLDKKTLEKLDPVVLQRQLDILRTESDGSSRYLRAIAMVESVLAAIRPNKTQLLANYPNPSNPETWIPYQLAKPADVSLTIYNVKGVVVRQLKLGQQQAGIYHSRSRAAHWDGKNESGESVASGVYFYVFKAGKYTAMRKMLIRK